jgi:hypothetical protein
MRKALAVCGVSLACAGVGIGLFILISGLKARSLDSPLVDLSGGCPEGVACSQSPQLPPPSCSKETLVFRKINASKVMSVSESQKLTATFINQGQEKCRVSIALDAPNFTTSGEKKQTFSIAQYASTEFNWVLSSDKPGTYTVIVSISTGDDAAEIIDSKDVGISVTNVFGLQASQASLLSILSAAFGPILTVPFWLDKWQKRTGKESKIETKS